MLFLNCTASRINYVTLREVREWRRLKTVRCGAFSGRETCSVVDFFKLILSQKVTLSIHECCFSFHK